MGKLCFLVVAAFALCGCIGSAPKAADNWAIEFWRANEDSDDRAAEPRYGAVRIAQVTVRAPYDGTRLAVMRADGSLAFDSYNAFAAAPSQMLRGAVQDAIEASGIFERVVTPNSSASCDLSLETTVTRIALDCRKEGRREASVELTMLLLKGREPIASVRAEGKAGTGDKDYSAAFSRALARAIKSATSALAPQD